MTRDNVQAPSKPAANEIKEDGTEVQKSFDIRLRETYGEPPLEAHERFKNPWSFLAVAGLAWILIFFVLAIAAVLLRPAPRPLITRGAPTAHHTPHKPHVSAALSDKGPVDVQCLRA